MSSQSTNDRELNAPGSGVDDVSSRSGRRLDRERSQRLTGHRVHSWSRRSRRLLVVVVVLALSEFFTALLLGTQVYSLSSRNQKLRADLTLKEEELSQVVPELKVLRADLDTLIRGKLPRLHKMEYDQVLSVDQGYLKNVTFTEIVNRDTRGYEYKLVVQNNTRAPLWPEIQLYLFNELGIQIGSAEIGTRNPNAVKAGSLGIGEVRSYSGLLELADRQEAPAYFMIRNPAEAGSETDTARHRPDPGR